MTLSEELAWRGFTNQTTYKDTTALDGEPVTFYWGVDPSSDSMTIGNLAAAMMVKTLMKHGHKAVLLVGGATGLIGDPDGKNEERVLQKPEEIERNAKAIANQYDRLFEGEEFKVVNNAEWFNDMGYIEFLRETGKHVPMRQMLGREFIQTRLGEESSGISYAEFSYALIQAYDFLRLHEKEKVTLQVCGSDQWGNAVAGVDLIRRKTGNEAHVYTAPLVVNTATGRKFGKTEAGAIWLDPKKTTSTQFYQFWINTDDSDVESFLKIFTQIDRGDVDDIMDRHRKRPEAREAQQHLARAATEVVHGESEMHRAEAVTKVLTGEMPISKAGDETIAALRKEIPSATTTELGSIIEALAHTKLAASNSEARRMLESNAISINGRKVSRQNFEESDFRSGRLLLRRGKAFKDSALIELS